MDSKESPNWKTIVKKMLTYNWNACHLQHVGPGVAHVRFCFPPSCDESLSSNQPNWILWQADRQDMLAEGCRLDQLEQRQVIAIWLGHPEVKARVDDLLLDAVLLHGQWLMDVAQILGVQLPQIDCYVRQLRLLDAMGRRGHHVGRNEGATTLEL